MLESLHIENMAVIRSLDVDFSHGLSVITGETGSGKSVMIDCIAFLLGAKPARDLVRSGESAGLVSAVFRDVGKACLAYLSEMGLSAEDELLLQRTLSAEGKSQCRLNGRVIPLSMLRELSRFLMSIHGQNDNQRLLQRSVQASVLDSCADFGGADLRYRELYRAFGETRASLEALARDGAEKNRLRDILAFQIADIDAAKLTEGEEEQLLAKRTKLQNAEKIAKQSAFAYLLLHGSEKGATTLLDRAAQAVSQLSSALPEAGELAGKLTEMRYEVEDIANTVRDFGEDTEGDPAAALDRVESRLDTITKLRRKYGADIAEILAFRRDAAERLSALEHSDEESERLGALLRQQEKELFSLADELHRARASAAAVLSRGVLEGLAFLDMPSVKFEIRVSDTGVLGAAGTDEIEFCIATNPGEPTAPLSHIASGGELARIMLALKSVLNDRDGVTSAVFDEVDTGISGKTSRKIGIKLSEIGRHTQVLCVTHSAQIASLATAHYKIQKQTVEDRAVATVSPLDEEGRVAEVARILGGLAVTASQTAAARDMIEEGRALR